MKRLLTIILCLSLLLGCLAPLAEAGTVSAPRANVTDTDAPNIVSFKLKENKKTLKPGDKLHIQVKTDDRSDVKTVNVQFYNTAYGAYILVELNYDPKTDMFVGEHTLEKSLVNGTFVLNSLTATDKYHNNMLLWEGKGFASFKLSGASDGVLKATVKIQENGKKVKAGDPIHVEVKIPKAINNVQYAIVEFSQEGNENQRNGYFIEKTSSTEFKGTFSLDESKGNGKYNLRSVSFMDGNYNECGSVQVSGQSFTLTGGVNDKAAPVVSSITFKERNKTLKPGNTVHISYTIKDESTIISSSAYFAPQESIESWNKTADSAKSMYSGSFPIPVKYNSASKKWEGSAQIPKDLPNGKYRLRIFAEDSTYHYISDDFDNITFNFKEPDYVDEGMKAFITVCWNAIWKKNPTASEVNKYGMPLANSKQKAADVIQALMKKAKLSGAAAAEALWQIMQGKTPSASEKSKTVTALKKSLDNGIDSLNNAAFRKRCKEWGINAGNLGTKAADTKVSSVDVDGGHYTLDGSKATLAGVTDKNIKKLVVRDTVKANGKSYKVTSIDRAACYGLKKLTTLTIGKNITSIGSDAFNSCKKLKTITINTTKLKTVGVSAFSGIKSSAAFKCPKKQLKKYEKLIRDKKKGNAPKKVKFK